MVETETLFVVRLAQLGSEANVFELREPQTIEFQDRGEMLSLGIGDATLTGLGITLAGPLAFQLRRATYLTRMPGLSVGVRSAGAWLLKR